MGKEKEFFKALRNVFLGEKVEGEGGFIHLMQIKAEYYKKIETKLKTDIDKALKSRPQFKEELFTKMVDFFSRYFSENGSIFFNKTIFHNNVYEKVYTDEKDVMLFWKTKDLYYVKTDMLFKSLTVPVEGFNIYFDASKIANKQNNERRDIIYEYIKHNQGKDITFKVDYKQGNKKNKIDDIIKSTKNIALTEEVFIQATKTFEKQCEVDFFIHKNAKAFLEEQFKLWSYQYFWEGGKDWSADRVNELQILKGIIFKVIEFVAQFENELVKIWNKPKFVRKSNYVVTLDRIADRDISVVNKIVAHTGMKEQEEEWVEFGIVKKDFKTADILDKVNKLADKYAKLPIDTKYFKDIELDIIGVFECLDDDLDGWLIKSENYQALNTIKDKFNNRVQTVYLDPPFNLDKKADYYYNVNYKDSTWITILENKYDLLKTMIDKTSSIFTRCDNNGNMFVRILNNSIWGEQNLKNEIIIRKTTSLSKRETTKLERETESLFFYCADKSENQFFQLLEYRKPEWVTMQEKPNRGQTGKSIFIDGVEYKPREGWCWARGNDVANEMYKKNRLKIEEGKIKILLDKKTIGSNWTDIVAYTSHWNFRTENSERLLKRIIELTTKTGDIVCDYFSGSGTTISTAQKLKRRWIGIDMGEYTFRYDAENSITGSLVRLKEVLAKIGNHEPIGISKSVNWEGGGFFKYYEFEQYEDVLKQAKYEDGDVFDAPGKTPYQEYVFLKDEKMLKAVKVDYKANKVKVDLSKLYDDIDIAETLSNLLGKKIKKITKDEVEFTDGKKRSLTDIDYKEIRPLLWW